MKRYLENHVNEDGGVGLHIEGHSTMFGSVLTYVALRCLGEELESSNVMEKMQQWIKTRRGDENSELEVLVSDAGMLRVERFESNSPECWLLPYWFPAHQGVIGVTVEWYIYPCPICTASGAQIEPETRSARR